MSEYICRGKQRDNGEWIEGYYLLAGGITYILPTGGFLKDIVEVDPDTVGRSTSLTDKNGVKIFEGDIIRISIPILGAQPIVGVSDVYFENGCFSVNWGGDYRPHHRTRIDSFILESTFEVIGNIHDNPELLSKEES